MNQFEYNRIDILLFQRFIAIIGDAIEKHGHVSEEALKGTVEMNKHEQWLTSTIERLQEVFLRHEKVQKFEEI